MNGMFSIGVTGIIRMEHYGRMHINITQIQMDKKDLVFGEVLIQILYMVIFRKKNKRLNKMAKKIVSPKWSFKAWELWMFVKGRKKLLIAAIGAIAGWIITQDPALSAVAGGGAELLYALLEYFVKKY